MRHVRAAQSNMHESTIKKLEGLFDADQQAIRDFRSGLISSPELKTRQKANGKMVRDIIENEGFPFPERATEKAYKAAFLAVLHCSDTDLMQSVLLSYEKREDQSLRKDEAYLTDKILVIQGRPQLYGTQYKVGPDGNVTFFEIEKPDQLENRRAPMGLGTHAEYLDIILSHLKG